jgi:hypothetical protein
MDLEELLALAATAGDLTDEQISEALADLRSAAAAFDPASMTDTDLETLTAIAEAINGLSAESDTRAAAAEERANAAAELLSQIAGDGEGDDEGGEGDDAAEGDDDADDATGEADAEPEGEASTEPEADATAEPIAAAAKPRLAKVAARRPAATQPRAVAKPVDGPLTLVASANVPGVNAGQKLSGPDAIAQAFAGVMRATSGYQGPRVEMPIARLGVTNAREFYGEDRTLDGDDAKGNARKIQALTRPEALIASGGICAPAPMSYDYPVVGDASRPFRDSFLTRFGADRGQIRTLTPPTLADADGAVGFWTEANDQTPGSDGPATKICMTLSCPDDSTTLVEAVTKCVEIGNFRAKYFAEQVEAILKLVAVNHARLTEIRLMNAFHTNATKTTSGELLGATRDMLAALDRVITQWRYRHRLAANFPLDVAMLDSVKALLRTDLARATSYGTLEENLAVADARIEAFFTARNLRPIWVLDARSGFDYAAAQADGPVHGWTNTIQAFIAESGTSLFLDGGSLDFGLVRDSVLNGTNDYQVFSETFEGFHPFGREWQSLTMNVCPNGTSSAPIDASLLCTDHS